MATFSVTSPISEGASTANDAQPFAERTVQPIIQYIEKEVPVIQERIVEVKVEVEKIVDRPVEVIREVIKEVRVEVPVIQEKIVEVIKEVPTIIEKEVQVFVDRVIEAPIQRVYSVVKVVPNAIWYVLCFETLIIALMAHYLAK